jgi:hypothetical protein
MGSVDGEGGCEGSFIGEEDLVGVLAGEGGWVVSSVIVGVWMGSLVGEGP